MPSARKRASLLRAQPDRANASSTAPVATRGLFEIVSTLTSLRLPFTG